MTFLNDYLQVFYSYLSPTSIHIKKLWLCIKNRKGLLMPGYEHARAHVWGQKTPLDVGSLPPPCLEAGSVVFLLHKPGWLVPGLLGFSVAASLLPIETLLLHCCYCVQLLPGWVWQSEPGSSFFVVQHALSSLMGLRACLLLKKKSRSKGLSEILLENENNLCKNFVSVFGFDFYRKTLTM